METFATKCKVERNDELGRYVVAVEPLKAGETILLEEPTLLCPMNDERRCSNCFKVTDLFCNKCQIFSLCSACSQHGDCEFLAKIRDRLDDPQLLQQKAYEIFVPLKALLLRESPQTMPDFDRLFELEAHLEERRKLPLWKTNDEFIVQPFFKSGLVKLLLDGEKWLSADVIQRICAIMDVNCFEIRAPDEGAMRGLYIRSALMNHSCVANTCIAVDSLYKMKVYAACDIAPGDMITVCYTNVLLGTDERREMLLQGKYFQCKCKRCEDPTELGSHMSSFLCNPCLSNRRPGAAVVQRSAGKWQCIVCDHTLGREHVATVLERAKEEIFHAKDDIYRYEMLLAKLSRILYPSHYLVFDLKQNIAAILRSILQNLAHRPGRKVHERKVQLCREILTTLHVIQPGISRLKAIAMYELCNSQAELSRMKFHEKDLSQEELILKLQECEMMLREAIRMLLYEPASSPEGKLARDMLKELKDLQNDIKLVQDGSPEN